MAVRPTLDLFGGFDLFQTPQVALSKEATSLFNDVETSSAVEKAFAEMQAQAKANDQIAQNVLKQQEAYQQQVAKAHEESTRRLAEAIKERQRREEEAKKEAEKRAKEAKKALDENPTALIDGDLSEFLNSEAFKKAGDLRQMDMARKRAVEIEQRLLAQGVDAEAAKRSANTFLGNVQGEVTRLKNEADTSIGWIKDMGSMIAKTFNDQQSAGNTKDAGLILDAQEALKRGQTASGWAVDEILDVNPNVRKYLKKTTNLGLDSLSTFAIRDDLTLEQRKELDAEITKAYNTVKAKEAQNIKEADSWYNNVSREQQIERDNYQFELQQAAAKYSDPNAPITSAEGLAMAAESAFIASKYPITMLVDQSGSLAVGVGGGLVQAGVGLALAPVTGGASTANTAVGLARAANTLKNISGVLFNGIASAKMVEAEVINSSRDGILNTEISVLAKANPELWSSTLELSGGNEELARQRLATIRADDHAGKALLLGFAAGALGPETLITRAINKNIASRAITESVEGIVAQSTAGITARSIAKNIGLWGVGTTAEGAEEGLTTYLTNLTIHGVNPDHDLWEGVAEAIGTGAMVGGMVSSSALMTGSYGDIRRGTAIRDKAVAVSPLTDDAITANVAKYKELGDVDFATLRQTMMNDLNAFESNISNAFATSPDAIKRQRQMYYDTYINNQEILAKLTKAQQNELKELASNAFGGSINTNSYSVAQDTAIMQVLRDATKPPVVDGHTNAELLDLWRVVHNKELDQVVDAKKANTMAQVYKRMFPDGANTQENTRQRAERMTAIMRDLVNENSSISARDKAEYLRTAATYFDTVPRRDGDKVDVATGTNTDQRANSANDGGGVLQDQPSPPSEETPATDGGQADVDTQGVGDGGQGQANQSESSTKPATQPSGGSESSVSGPRETSETETTANPAGTSDVPSTTPTGEGGIGATNQAAGSVVATNTQATTTSTGGGVVGVTTTERSADGERNQTTTTSESIGGTNGQTNTTQNETGFGDGSFSTEVRNAKNTTIGYRRTGEATTWSYQAHQFKRASLKEHGVFLHTNASNLWGSPSNAEKYLMGRSAEDLLFMYNKHLTLGVGVTGTDWVSLVQREWDRRAYTSQLPTKPSETQTSGQSIYDITTVADSVGMVASRGGRDGIIIVSQGEVVFMPYDGSIALVLDNPNATLAQYGLLAPVGDVKRTRAYENRLKNPRTEPSKIFKELEQALRTEESNFSFATEPTAVKSGKVQSQETLDAKLETAIDSIMNQLDMTVDEALDFIEYTVAGKLYNDGEFNNLDRQDQVQLVQDLATELMHDPNSSTLYKASLANKGIAQEDQLQSRLLQSGVHTDMVWSDIYSRFNHTELVKVHGKTDPIVGTADLVRELQSIKEAAKTALSRIIPETLSKISPESTVTLNTLVRVINDQNNTGLLDADTVTPQDVASSLLQASDNARKKFLTSYAKLVPESDRKVFRKALTSLTNELVDANAVAREAALSEATKPAYKRKTVQRKITPQLRSKATATTDTQTDTNLLNGGNTNETQNARSERSTPTEATTDENGQNELGVVSSTDDQAGAVRGQNEDQTPLNSQEITSEELSNETSNETNTGYLPITNEQSEQADATVRETTQPTEATEAQARGNKTTVTADELSTTHTEVANNEPAKHNSQPVAIEGTTPSDQVAKVEPVVTEDGTAITEVYVPEGEHTPAELEASDKFDTDPIPSDVTAEDGRSIYEIAIELADSVGYATLDVINPNKLTSKKNRKGKLETPAPDEKRPADKARKDRLYTNENALLREVRERLYDTVQKSDNTRAQWLEFMLATENGGDLLELINSTEFIQSGIDAAMSDSSVASAREPIEKFWVWNPKHNDPKYKDKKFGGLRAAGQKVGSVIAGITPHFDDWVNNIPGVPRTGMAQDSNVVSVSLAKIDAQRGAIHGFVHKTYIQPVLDLTRDMSFKYTEHENEVGTDFGNYATYTHVFEEGATALFANAEQEISYLKDSVDAIVKEAKALHSDFASDEFTEGTLFDNNLVKSNSSRLADHQKDSYKELVTDYHKLTSELDKAQRNLTRSKDVYYGKKSRSDYSTGVKLPYGMTKAELEQGLKEIEAKYEKADLEAVAEKIYHAYRGMQAIGVAYGVYDSQTLKEINANKFEKYVPLYHAKKDKPNEYEEDVVNESLFDGFEDENLIRQYKTLGLTRDISRFRRKGSVSRGQDAITNLGLAARNLSGRAASVEFEQNIQGLFEGTLDQPMLEGKPTEDQIKSFQKGLVQKGVVDGLVRIRADIPKRYVPSEFADIIPVVAKGWEIDENGEYKSVTYNYYFTDKVIQAELTHKADINHKFNTNSIVANIRTLTRWRASYMTSRSLSWNFWNFFKEAFERGTTLMFRPVVDDNGKRVSGTKLMVNFGKNLTTLASNPQAHEEVYRYLALREIKTPLQREVHNLYTSGTIQLVTDLTDKYNLMGEQDRAALDNLAIKIEKGLLKAGTKSSFTNWATLKGADLVQQYHLRVAETPQVLNALAMYKAYTDAGVNTREARHRVRDAFDPTRVKSNAMMWLSNFFPFVRSAGAGNYNTMRTFGDVFYRDGAKAKVKFALLGLSAYAQLQIASFVFGDDEDGNDLLAQMPQSELNRGIPFKLSDGKVIFFPVGHGILNMVWSTVTAIHKLINGTSSVWDLVNNTIDQTVKNIAPIQAPTPDSVANSGGKALFLNIMPTMVLPIAEVILNQTQFGSNDIVRSDTPKGERDSDQDNFATPEVYKEMAKDLYKVTGGVIDWRPENIHHLARAYAGVGPFRAIDASLQDKGAKTGGVFVNKGEQMGPVITALGADAGISTSVLSAESRYWEMFKHQAKILNKYNIQVTMPAGETYDKVDVSHLDLSKENPDRETRAERYAHQLTKAGATREETQFVINMELAETERKNLRKKLQPAGISYYNSITKGTASEFVESDVQKRAIALLNFYEQAVRDNNQYVYGKK